MKKVFLGGTCNDSTWRDLIIPMLKIDYFNPMVSGWTKERMIQCDFCLYTITPKMTGIYSIAEVIDDSNKKPHSTILVLLKIDDGQKFTKGQWRSLGAVAKIVSNNGGQVFDNLRAAAHYLNSE